ncbi:unnamed protein product [Amaranthus hypochondriacus]
MLLDDGCYDRIMQKRMHIVLYYKNKSEENSGWHVGRWIKETLGNALVDHPIMAGRIRRVENGGLEIVANDSGVRIVEGEISLSLVEFFECKRKNNEVEGKLVSWVDVETNPQFSPLFYIQVTNFKCGGYSIGISCSLFLVDPLFMANFLNKWAKIHRNIAYEGEIPKLPLFPILKSKNIRCSLPFCTTKKTSKTILFNILMDEKFDSSDTLFKYFVLLCLNETESKFDYKISTSFTLITKGLNGNIKVENLSKQTLFGSLKNLKYKLTSLSIEDLGMNEIVFHDGNGPIDTSLWIDCDALEGTLVVISSLCGKECGMKVNVTFPIS